MDGSPFVFFGVTLSAQSDFLDLGGSELERPDSLPLLILHLCDSNRSVGVVTVVLCAADLVLGSELDLGVGQNDLAAALECTVDGQSCQSVADGSTVGGASLLDGGLEQPHNGVGLSRVTVHVETVCLLSKLNVKHHIEVEITMDELDLTAAESKATYDEIKAYVLEKFGFKVSQLYIAQIKRKCGIIERKNYNQSKKEDAKVPKCPPEKEAAIMDALKHFQMIP